MCVILCKIKGSDFPGSDTIKKMMKHNPDGFGMAWNQNGKVRIFKTLDPKEALARYEGLAATLDPAETGFLFHARIKTHGTVKLENCHPWIGSGLAFAHNGVLHNVPARGDMTDSETFFRDYYLPALNSAGGLTYARRIANAIVGTSKFAFLDSHGNFDMIGDWRKYQELGKKGVCYYSNLFFMPQPTTPFYSDSVELFQKKTKGGAKGAKGSQLPSVGKERGGSFAKPLPVLYRASDNKPLRLADIDCAMADIFDRSNTVTKDDIPDGLI